MADQAATQCGQSPRWVRDRHAKQTALSWGSFIEKKGVGEGTRERKRKGENYLIASAKKQQEGESRIGQNLSLKGVFCS